MADYVVRFTGQDNLSGTVNGIKKGLQGVDEQATKLEKIQQRFERINNSAAPLKKQLKDMQTLLANMNMDGLGNTQVYSEIASRAGEIKDAMTDASNSVKRFASDTSTLDATIQAFQGLSGVIGVASGTMNLFGVENDKVQKAMLKVQSAISIMNGLQQIANVLNKNSALMERLKALATKEATVAINAETTATKAATVATKGLKAALASTGIGIAVVALGTIVSMLMEYSDKADEAAESQDKLTESLQDTAKSQQSFKDKVAESTGEMIGKYKLLQTQWDSLKTTMEKTQFIKDNADKFKELGGQVDNVSDAEAFLVKNTDNVIAALNARARAIAAQGALVDAYKAYYDKLKNLDSVEGGNYYYTATKGIKYKDLSADEQQATGIKVVTQGQATNANVELNQAQIDKVNAYRSKKASETYKKNTDVAKKELDKQTSYYTKEINAANEEASYLNWDKSGSSRSSTPSSRGGNTNTEHKNPYLTEAQKKVLDSSNQTFKDLQESYNASAIGAEKYREELDKLINSLSEAGIKSDEINKPRKSVATASELGLGVGVDTSGTITNPVELPVIPKLDITAINNGMFDTIIAQIDHIQDQMYRGFMPKDIGQTQIEQLTKLLEGITGKKWEINVDTGQLREAATSTQKIGNTAGTIGDIASGFANIGQAIQGLTDNTEIAQATIVAQAIATLSLSFADAMKSASSNWVTWLAFGLTGTATLISMIAQIKSANAGGYADGGIISGNSFHGDRLLANVNAGEMILNQKQQANLFKALDSGNLGGKSEVTFKLKGSDIYGSLRNYNNKTSKLK